MQDIGFTVESKNLSFTHRLNGHFLNRCGNKSLCSAPSWTHGSRLYILACLFVRLHSYRNSYVASYAPVAIGMKTDKNSAPYCISYLFPVPKEGFLFSEPPPGFSLI